MMRAIVIEDDKRQLEHISSMVSEIPEVELVGKADGVRSGLSIINEKSPDLALMDIRLKDGLAFDILCKLKDLNIKVIFITAYEEYALKAIKFNALDFILKPITFDQLRLAVDKARSHKIDELNMQLTQLQTYLISKKNEKIILRSSDKIHLVPIQEIVYCEARRNYTDFFLINKKRITACVPLKEYEFMLDAQIFLRIHKSYIVNLDFIESYSRSDGGHVILSTNTILPVSDRKKQILMGRLRNL